MLSWQTPSYFYFAFLLGQVKDKEVYLYQQSYVRFVELTDSEGLKNNIRKMSNLI